MSTWDLVRFTLIKIGIVLGIVGGNFAGLTAAIKLSRRYAVTVIDPTRHFEWMPNIHEITRHLGGRLLPFGWLRLLWGLKVRHPLQDSKTAPGPMSKKPAAPSRYYCTC